MSEEHYVSIDPDAARHAAAAVLGLVADADADMHLREIAGGWRASPAAVPGGRLGASHALVRDGDGATVRVPAAMSDRQAEELLRAAPPP